MNGCAVATIFRDVVAVAWMNELKACKHCVLFDQVFDKESFVLLEKKLKVWAQA